MLKRKQVDFCIKQGKSQLAYKRRKFLIRIDGEDVVFGSFLVGLRELWN